MTETKELHARLDALERKLAAARRDLEHLDDDARRGLGDWLEKAGDELDYNGRTSAGRPA